MSISREFDKYYLDIGRRLRKKKEKNQTKIGSSIRGKLSISSVTGCFEIDLRLKLGRYINFSFEFDDDEIPVGETFFFFFYLIVIQYEVVNIWNRSSIEISRFFANFHSRVSLFVFIRVHLSSIYILVLIRSLLPIMYEKGFRKSYIASETSINMTNGRNLFTNYFLRVVQYLFQSV